MEISREVEIKLSPKEAEDIIKEYLNAKHPDMKIERVHFYTSTVYEGYGDRGSVEVTKVNCSGKLIPQNESNQPQR